MVLTTAAGIGSGEEGQGELHDGGSMAADPLWVGLVTAACVGSGCWGSDPATMGLRRPACVRGRSALPISLSFPLFISLTLSLTGDQIHGSGGRIRRGATAWRRRIRWGGALRRRPSPSSPPRHSEVEATDLVGRSPPAADPAWIRRGGGWIRRREVHQRRIRRQRAAAVRGLDPSPVRAVYGLFLFYFFI